ncbi:Kunitz/Bovine pancreatic trypsin inhibitor domain protein [Ancylostoma caninum]|uniref:Kunitz/Bovine pancreatic trypsin inhibitor domain protein n=1 Tax=Ancylostoma caninum TaxID=29170 RepID=A0A368HAR6_ANCCA|nr:Kunitz/Bovine pancreatic trypsin inhibitor domain protein [Ancylostoma caninum]
MKFIVFLLCVLLLSEAQQDPRCVRPVTGPTCRALLKRWAYNPNDNKCEQFDYGGCGGTENNFETEEDCKNTCVV